MASTGRVGDLRLRLPQPVLPYNGTINATVFGNQCIQQTFPNVTLPSDVPAAAGQYLAAFLQTADVPQSEDCTRYTGSSFCGNGRSYATGLNLNVVVPANATTESKLPVAIVSTTLVAQWVFRGLTADYVQVDLWR